MWFDLKDKIQNIIKQVISIQKVLNGLSVKLANTKKRLSKFKNLTIK